MKKLRKSFEIMGIIAIFVLALVIGFSMVGCGDGDSTDPGGNNDKPENKNNAPVSITSVNITLTAPVKGASPDTTANGTGNFTIGTVSWTPVVGKFLGDTVYTAAVTLTAKSGYTFTGLSSATINGQNATVSNNTGSAISLSYTFMATETRTVAAITIETQPTKLTYTHGDQLDLAGLVVKLIYDDTTTENVAAANFESKNIVANPAHGNSLVYATHNNQPITITHGSFSNTTNKLTVNLKSITNAELNITAPVKNAEPDTTVTGMGNFTIGTVSWSPTDSRFLGGTEYTVTFTLTADSDYTFNGLNFATINGQNAVLSNNTGSDVTLSHTFPATDTRTVTTIAIVTQPTKLNYTHGEQLNLTGLEVKLTYDDNTTENVTAANFADKNISASPADGNHLVHITHNGHPVTIIYGDFTRTTNNLTVSKANGSFVNHTVINTTYTSGLKLSDLTLQTNYAWDVPNTILNAGAAQSFTATYIDPSGNYNSASGSITVNVAKAEGALLSAPTVELITHNSITLTEITTTTTGQAVEYSRSDTGSTSSNGIWQYGTSFTGLNTGTTYYFFARSAGNDNYETGAPSGSLSVITLQTVSPDRIEYYWVNEHSDLVTTSGGTTSINAGSTLTITAQGTGYIVQQWRLNGINIGQSGNTYNFSRTTAGMYTVGLFVEKDGRLYNTNIIITVN